jgi:lipid-A-disaccharide synthase
VPVSFVGHPVAERTPSNRSPEDLREAAGFDRDSTVVALLPGSRRGEVERLLPVLLDAAALLREKRPDVEFLIPLAPGLRREVIEAPVAASGLEGCRIHDGDFPDVLRACAAGAVASGTASLEAAMVGLPMVVVYRVRRLSYAIGAALVRVDHIALPNLIAQKRVVPELVQRACTAEAVASHIEAYLDRPERVRGVREGLAEVRRRLGDPGVFERAATAVLAELDAVTGAASPPAD